MMHNEIIETLSKGSAYINHCIVSKETGLHSHNFAEIAYVTDGVGKHIIGDSFTNQPLRTILPFSTMYASISQLPQPIDTSYSHQN